MTENVLFYCLGCMTPFLTLFAWVVMGSALSTLRKKEVKKQQKNDS